MRGDPSGQTLREQLLVGAQSFRPVVRDRAREQLVGPPVPPSVAHLREWMFLVHGQSGYTMDGPIPATIDTIQRVLAALGIEPAPTEDELMAIRQLDTVFIASSREKAPSRAPAEESPHGHRRR